MKKALTFNYFTIVFNALISILMYYGILDVSGMSGLDGMLFWILAPIIFLIHLTVSLIMEKRGGYTSSDFYALGSVFSVFPIAIIVKAISSATF